jgi:hypothetical protein
MTRPAARLESLPALAWRRQAPTPRSMCRATFLPGHTVITTQERGWGRRENGALLGAAEEAALDVLLATDREVATVTHVVTVGARIWRAEKAHSQENLPAAGRR